MFVGLSSGFDAGAVALSLFARHAAPCAALGRATAGQAQQPGHAKCSRARCRHYLLSILGHEDADVLRRRAIFAAADAEAMILPLRTEDLMRERRFLRRAAEDLHYMATRFTHQSSVLGDPASAGLSALCREARSLGALAYISGTGADEIISDYGHGGVRIFQQSSFGGFFPEDLASVFPWQNVFLGTQRDYLSKEESVAGAHGLEGRYPFLDPQVVQEFLWLQPSLKNGEYKGALRHLLQNEQYPIAEGKQGFNPQVSPAYQYMGLAASSSLHLGGSAVGTLPVQRCATPRVRGARRVCPHGAHSALRPTSIDAGTRAVTDSPSPGALGSNCAVECRRGWTLVLNTLVCTASGQWAGAARCKPTLRKKSARAAKQLPGRGPDDFEVVTVATADFLSGPRASRLWKLWNALPAKVRLLGHEYRGPWAAPQKVQWLHEYLHEEVHMHGHADKIVLFLDAGDIAFWPGCGRDLINTFLRLDADIVFGAELGLFPDRLLHEYSNNETLRRLWRQAVPVDLLTLDWTRLGVGPGQSCANCPEAAGYMFLNSGVFMGRASNLLAMTTEIGRSFAPHGMYDITKCHEDRVKAQTFCSDQFFYTGYFLASLEGRTGMKVVLDYRAELALNLHGLRADLFTKSEGVPVFKPYQQRVCLGHGSGGAFGEQLLWYLEEGLKLGVDPAAAYDPAEALAWNALQMQQRAEAWAALS